MSMLRRTALAVLLVSIVLLPGCDVTGLVLVDVEQAENVIFTGGLFDFGNSPIGTPTSASFQIVNHGQDDVTLPGTVEISGTDAADFAVTAQPDSTIPAGGSVSFTVEFTPSTYGLVERARAAFALEAGTYVVNLVGVGEGSSGQLPVEVDQDGSVIHSGGLFDFGNSLPGTATSVIFEIVNHGMSDVTLPGSVQITGAYATDFVVTAQPAATVAAGGSVPFTVEFTPSTAGILERAQASFETDAGTYIVNLIGVGEGASGSLFMEFNGDGWRDLYPGDTVNLWTGTPSSMSFRIDNTHLTEALYLVGSPAVVITNSSDAFTLTISPTSPVDPDTFTEFEITFNAPGYGIYQETVTVRTTDPTYPEFTFTIVGDNPGAN
jgi:trimeric autotransporter adhesin